jgi:hypothetical protein
LEQAEKWRLLTIAENAGFELLQTTDKNTAYQQDLSGRRIAVVVLGQQQWPDIRPHIQLIVDAVNAAKPGSNVEIEIQSKSS